jgi:endonuclease/exonuclease/phosphatase (EEP) superfamily protein YafD
MGNWWRENIRAARQRGWRAVVILSILGGGVSVLGLAGGLGWGFDLCNHFQAQYFVFQALCVAGLLALRRWRWALVPALLLAMPALRLAPYYRPLPDESPLPRHLRVLSFNVLSANTCYAATLRWIQQSDPDVAFFSEVTPAWAAALEPLKARMPYFVVRERTDNFGLAVYSKHPIIEQILVPSTLLEVAILQLTLGIDGNQVVFVGMHPMAPLCPAYARDRDAGIKQQAARMRHETRPLIVAGDFNATPWSHAMTPLIELGLRDTMLGRGFSATWQRRIPLFAIPIDQILLRGPIRIRGRWTGPDLGSDHRPVMADLTW